MLIPSPRHTKDDLQLWAEYEKADMLRPTVNRVEAAIANLTHVEEPAYISVSWGKDSVTTAELVLAAYPKIPLVWIAEEPMAGPHCRDVRDAFLKRHPTAEYHEVILDYTGTDSRGDKRFKRVCREVSERFGKPITGYRSEESRVRKIRFAIWGIESPKSVCPIGYWKNADVFAFCAQQGLPVHPNYAMLGGGRYPRERLRVDCLAGEEGTNFGRDEWEYEYYPDIRNRLLARPNVGIHQPMS